MFTNENHNDGDTDDAPGQKMDDHGLLMLQVLSNKRYVLISRMAFKRSLLCLRMKIGLDYGAKAQ